MAGLDPRVLQGQQRSFEVTAQLLLSKRQAEAETKQKVLSAKLKALTGLANDDTLPLSTRAQAAEELVTSLHGGKPRETGDAITAESLGNRERDIRVNETMQDAFLQAMKDNPELAAQINKVLLGQRGAESLEFTAPPLQAARTATEKQQTLKEKELTGAAGALTGQRKAATALSRQKVKLLKVQTDKAAKKLSDEGLSETKRLQNFLDASSKELRLLTVPGENRSIEGKEARFNQLQEAIKRTTDRFLQIAGQTDLTDSGEVAKRLKLLGRLARDGHFSSDNLRSIINQMVEAGVPSEFIERVLAE